MDQGILLNIGRFPSSITAARGVKEVLIHLPPLFILDKITPYNKRELNPLSLITKLTGTLFNIYIYINHLLFYIFLSLPLLTGLRSLQFIF